MATDRRFILLCTAEVLVVAAGNIVAALILQMIVLAAFIEYRRGFATFAAATIAFSGVIAVSSTVSFPLLALAGALGCGYLALLLQDYRLARWAGGEA
ncbi:hypothetical protein [Methanoculleus sp.]|uniref:hypothetical protein n=1 Tax=Methanoculleus sp. TaxID=90427 RepID=UPI0025D3B2B3|nr:hypothetical protein [Methanoculleus sp.]